METKAKSFTIGDAIKRQQEEQQKMNEAHEQATAKGYSEVTIDNQRYQVTKDSAGRTVAPISEPPKKQS